jgi:DNA-binding Lrp family transcriptional regulator
MTKNSRDLIVQDEKKLLSELVKHSNEKIEMIAKHCGFSRQKTWRIIKHLEEKAVIWGYTAIFDEQKIGQQHFILMINRTMEKMEEKVVDIIVSSKTNELATELGVTIESSAYVHGDYDWIMTITTEGIKQAKRFSDS